MADLLLDAFLPERYVASHWMTDLKQGRVRLLLFCF
jgi:hypothetical protein